jgi:hypothetical protein
MCHLGRHRRVHQHPDQRRAVGQGLQAPREDPRCGAKKRKEAAEKALKEADDILKKKPKKPEKPVVCKKRPSSFLPGTLVLLADGTHRPIEDIRVGDQVWATDPETGVSGPRQVTHLITSQGVKQLVDLTVGNLWLGRHTITATGPHPFWNFDKDTWIQAGDLNTNDHLTQPNGRPVSLSSIHHRSQPQRVYNLTVMGLHTYYVLAGSTPVLVHNTALALPAPRKKIPLGGKFHGELDQFNTGGQASWEMHIYENGKEVGVRGPHGWIWKHGWTEAPVLPESVEKTLNDKAAALNERFNIKC